MSHCDGRVGHADARCLLQGRPRAASRRWRSSSPSGSAASSSTRIPCRSIATCASSPRGRRRGRGARAAPALRPCRCGGELFGRRAGAPMPRRRWRRPGERGRLPIVIGGTGLYFKALTQGLSAVPPTPPDIRAAVRARLRHARAWPRCTPNWRAAIRRWRRGCRPGDTMRIGRALEVLEATGRSLADWHRDGMPAVLDRRARRRRVPRRRSGPSSIAGSMPASTPCWRPARWTR